MKYERIISKDIKQCLNILYKQRTSNLDITSSSHYCFDIDDDITTITIQIPFNEELSLIESRIIASMNFNLISIDKNKTKIVGKYSFFYNLVDLGLNFLYFPIMSGWSLSYSLEKHKLIPFIIFLLLIGVWFKCVKLKIKAWKRFISIIQTIESKKLEN